ncbi:MAG: hypothetical protein COA79_00955 [Planctomycetota bacterium]|nr:MAG: hypothetical protein COA79_00955 [Planctomycetota bacterium]
MMVACLLFGCFSDDNEGIFDSNTVSAASTNPETGNDGLAMDSGSPTSITFSEDYLLNSGEIYLIKNNGEYSSATINSIGTASLSLPTNEPFIIAVPNLINDLIVWDQNLKLFVGIASSNIIDEIDGNPVITAASKNYLNSLSSNIISTIETGGSNLKLEGDNLASFQLALSEFSQVGFDSYIEAEVLKLSVLINGDPLFSSSIFLSNSFISRIDKSTVASTGQLLIEQLSSKLDFTTIGTSSLLAKETLVDSNFQASIIESLVLYSLDHDDTMTASVYFKAIIKSSLVLDDLSSTVSSFQNSIDDFKAQINSSSLSRDDLLLAIKTSLQATPIQITIE